MVLSTAWRLNPSRKQFLVDALAPLSVIGYTPDLRSNGRNRGAEVSAYLAQHPEIERFVILDDDYAEDFRAEGLATHLVQTHLHMDDPLEEGLTALLADEAINVLQTHTMYVPTALSEASSGEGLVSHSGRVHVFILAGQSNMVGRAEGESLPDGCKQLREQVRLSWCNNLNFAETEDQVS